MTAEPLVVAEGLTRRFGPGPGPGPPAVDGVNLRVEPGRVTGLVGPDGAGKTTLMRLMSGLLRPDSGRLQVCGLDPTTSARRLRRLVGYMPQRFGLYEDLSVLENLRLYADLRGVVGAERRRVFDRLLDLTDLARFTGRLAGRLSGGMKQKLGIACALVRAPRLLLLDEPGVGVDPISRRELWRMVNDLVGQGIGVVWSTAYLDEAERCETVVLLHDGRVVHDGPPAVLTRRVEGLTFLLRDPDQGPRSALARALRDPGVADGVVQGRGVRLVFHPGEPPTVRDLGGGPKARIEPVAPRFEDAFISLLGGLPKVDPGQRRDGPATTPKAAPVIEAERLTRRFGHFTAADSVTFSVSRGEIFGLLGPNGAGKSTTFKMMCGLLRPTSGRALVVGLDLARAPAEARAKLGYMAQKFSLYGDLSVRQNLNFFAGAYGLGGRRRREAVDRVVAEHGLGSRLSDSAGGLPLGFKQRLALACAVLHEPPLLFLDEPTSGVDPRARREFWLRIQAMVETGVTVLVTTHFMDEAEYCDRVALIHRGRLIALDAPDNLKSASRSESNPEPTMEDAFIDRIEAFDQRQASSPAAEGRA